MSLQSVDIFGFKGGLQNKNKKPFLFVDDAFQELENAYCWREEIKKREGLKFVGRYRRVFGTASIGNSGASPWTVNIFSFHGIKGNITAITNANPGAVTTLDPHNLATGTQVVITGVGGMTELNNQTVTITSTGANSFTIGIDTTLYGVYTSGGIWSLASEPYAEIEPGSVIIIIGAITFTDQGNGLLTSVTPGNSGYIDYVTGTVVLTHTAGAGIAATASFAYFPGLPAMGILMRELSGINDDQTLWFDTKYCYTLTGSHFQEYLGSGTTWNGTDSDFFWGCNYRGAESSNLLFFVTNFYNDAGSPLRYTNGSSWSDFKPVLSQTGGVATRIFLTQGRVIISYYGRLLYLGVWETDADGAGNPNYASTRFIGNRCEFSQIGNPLETTVALPIVDVAWRRDQFGRGGFVDAPTNQEIISATFYKNTLIVFFEQSTWRLQYLGEYGLPFIWERISSDYGSESTFSPILFDNGVLAVGDKAIVVSNGGDVQRIDLDIPEEVYTFKNPDNGTKRIQSARDFRYELAYWCFNDINQNELPASYYPNYTLLYNYRNNTYAKIRNSITAFGTFQYEAGVTWDRTDIFWNDYNVLWASDIQENTPSIVSGNQQGFAHFYENPNVETLSDSDIDANDQESLSVTGITAGSTIELTVINHNLQTDEFIYLTGMNFVVTASSTAGSTTLNDQIYMVRVVDIDTIEIRMWSVALQQPVNDFQYTNVGTYVGGGVIALFPRVVIETKDFSPFKQQLGQNLKTSYIDFLFDVSTPSPINVILKMNTTLAAQGNVLIGNNNVETSNSKTGFITDVQQVSSPTVIISSPNHSLLTGDIITIAQVGGSTELNNNEYTITFLTTNTFSVTEASISTFTGGGYWEQTKQQYFTLSSQYAWHRFFSTCFGQFMSLILTYNNDQMSRLSTHQQKFVLNAMKIWFRPGGRNIFGK